MTFPRDCIEYQLNKENRVQKSLRVTKKISFLKNMLVFLVVLFIPKCTILARGSYKNVSLYFVSALGKQTTKRSVATATETMFTTRGSHSQNTPTKTGNI